MHIDRLTTVLETVALAGRAVSPAEVQQATGLPRPTCYRLLQSLAEQRLLDETHGTTRYLIGERLKRIALFGQTDADVGQVASPILKETAIEFGEAVFFSRFRDRTVEIIRVETPLDVSRSYIHPGLGNRPIHACSCSKVIAAFADKSFQKEILASPLRAYTKQTKTSPEEIQRDFDAIRKCGYAQCIEEIEIGVSSVAAPILAGNLGAPFSVGVTGPIRRFTRDYRKKIGTRLIEIADQISTKLQMTHNGSLG